MCLGLRINDCSSAYAAYVAGILINVVGFAGASMYLDPNASAARTDHIPIAGRTVPIAATHIYQMSFFTGFGVSAIIYCALSYAFPPTGAHATFKEEDLSRMKAEDEKLQAETSSVDKKEDLFVSTSAV